MLTLALWAVELTNPLRIGDVHFTNQNHAADSNSNRGNLNRLTKLP
jgi:hypothetical protein